MELALVLGHGGENVGGGFVDCGAQLLDQVAQEAVDHLLLLLAGFGGHFLVLHADQGVTACPVGLVADRDRAPEVVTFQFFTLAFEVAFGLDPFLLGGVFGRRGRERDVGVSFLPPQRIENLLLGGDLSGDATDERGDEQCLIEQVSLRFSRVAELPCAWIERLRSAEGSAGRAAVGVGQLGDDVGVRVAEFVAGVQVALLVGVVLGLPSLEVGGWDERAGRSSSRCVPGLSGRRTRWLRGERRDPWVAGVCSRS